MTGAGTATVAYLHEPVDNYMGSPSDTDYKVPGKDPSIEDITISNALRRMRIDDNTAVADAIATNFEGSFSLSFAHTNPWYLNHVFGEPPVDGGEAAAPYSYTWTFTDGRVQSSRWYMGLDYLSGTAERVLEGTVFGQMQVECHIGEPIRVSLTGFYGDESKNTSITPGSCVGTGTPLIFHGGSIEVPDSNALTKMDSATLDISTGARAQRGWDRHPLDAVIGAPEVSLDVTKTVTETDQLELAYGGTSGPQTQVNGAGSGTLSFASPGDTSLEFQLDTVTPDEYGWDDLVAGETDTAESWSAYVNDVTTIAESSESSAL
jgi:hypothetical protein